MAEKIIPSSSTLSASGGSFQDLILPIPPFMKGGLRGISLFLNWGENLFIPSPLRGED